MVVSVCEWWLEGCNLRFRLCGCPLGVLLRIRECVGSVPGCSVRVARAGG